MEKRFLVVNSGSSSERLALFRGLERVAEWHFEGDGEGQFICSVTREGRAEVLSEKWGSLDEALGAARGILEGIGEDMGRIDAILVRVVAAGRYFAEHHIVDEQTFLELEKARVTNPLHVPKTLRDIQWAQEHFPEVPVVAVSDSAALGGAARRDFEYALPKEVVEKYDLRRWGAHGASYGYIGWQMRKAGLVLPRMVVCHLGSGCSVTGMMDGVPVYTSMGETPLEGLLSSSRAGSVDPTIGALLGAEMGAEEAIRLMNQEGGLKAMTGFKDLRQVIEGIRRGDEECERAMDRFVEGIAGAVGEAAAKMGGIDGLVFTGTIGVRSRSVRRGVVGLVGFMGFKVRGLAGADNRAPYYDISAEDSKPIYVMPTDEAAYMVRVGAELL